jgi:DNA-binding CsgD family transcriptional regulator
MDDEELLDKIYEAGAIPELWPSVLGHFDQAAEAAGSVLFMVQGGNLKWTSSAPMHDLAVAYLERGYLGNDARTTRLVGKNHAGFLSELDVFTAEEWEADPIRREFWGPKGYGWGVATNVMVPTGEMMIFHAERRAADGPPDRRVIDRLDRLRPHLARAGLLSNRMAFERVQAAVAALELVGIPAAVLDGRGQALATNGLLDRLNPGVVQARPSRLALAHTGADALLARALEALQAEAGSRAPQSIPLPATEQHPPMIVHIHPVRGMARDIFTRAAAVMLVTPVEATEVPSATVIQGLFDLTPTEARVATELASGLTVNDIAGAHGTSSTTVRNQVRAVFAKTGMHRQADLVGLLRGLTPRR